MDLQKMRYKLYESHVLYKACEFYKQFKGSAKYSDLIYKNLADLYRIAPYGNKDFIVESLQYITIIAMAKELLTLLDEVYVKHNIDFNDPDVKNILQALREKLPDKLKGLDNAQVIKMIRDSIVHNSEDVHNLGYQYANLFDVKLRHKLLEGDNCHIQLTVQDMVSIVCVYDESRILNPGDWGYIDFKGKEMPSVEELLDAHKKYGNFNSYMSFVDKNGNNIELDKFQNRALFQFLSNNKKEIAEYSKRFGYGLDYFLIRFAPFRDNSLNHYEFKMNCVDNLVIMAEDWNITAEQLANKVKSFAPPRYFHFKNSKLYDSALYSSLAFSIFTQFSRDDLKEIIDKGETNYSAEEISHIRNAFVHGRYFYNYNDGFEIYDGTKELLHIKTLTYNNIVDILKLINNEIKNDGPIHINYAKMR